jgi:hypothetical protein
LPLKKVGSFIQNVFTEKDISFTTNFYCVAQNRQFLLGAIMGSAILS